MNSIFTKTFIYLCIFLLGIILLQACEKKESQISGENLSKFFQFYEESDYPKALSFIPSQQIDLIPYEKDKEYSTPYERDKDIYFDIIDKTSGRRERPEQHESDKEIQYYLGVINYWMNNLEQAKYKFLNCLQLDPTYRMAHVYLFKIFFKLESEVLSKSDDQTESIGQLLISKLGFGNSDLHYDMAAKLLQPEEKQEVPVLRISFLYDNSQIKDFSFEASTSYYPKNRGAFVNEVERPGLYRVEFITKDRHCLDEVYFPPEQKMYWDSVDESGKMTGGVKVLTKFSLSLDLVMPQEGDRVIFYNPEGKKIFEQSITE